MRQATTVCQVILCLILVGCGTPTSFIESERAGSNIEIDPDQIQGSIDDPGTPGDERNGTDDPGAFGPNGPIGGNPDTSPDGPIASNPDSIPDGGTNNPDEGPFDPDVVVPENPPGDGTNTTVVSLNFNGETQRLFSSSSYNTGERFAVEQIVMQPKIQTTTLNLNQTTRELVKDSATQGSNSLMQSDLFNQIQEDKKLDILIVVDNSGSMAEEQVNLASKLAPLLSVVNDTDWRIAVNTTDASDPCIKTVINKADANTDQKFFDAVNDGIAGAGNEQGILRAVQGLQAQCLNSSWVRDDSHLAVLIVSDEDNCSNGGCTGSEINNASYLTNYLSSQRALGTSAKVYGLVWHPSQDASQCSTGYHQANIYAQAIESSNGTWGSICDSDYSQTLSAISNDLSSSLNTQFALSSTPDMEQIKVYVDQSLQNSSTYMVDKNIVKFNQPPAPGSAIKIDYSVGGNQILQDIQLSKQPDVSTLEVYVDNQKLASTQYQYASGSNKVVLQQVIDNGEKVDIQYRKYAILPTRFSLGTTGAVEALTVKVDDQATNAYTYNSAQGTVTFSDAPDDGAKIEVKTTKKDGIESTYSFNPGAETLIQSIADAQTGDAIGYSYNNQMITIASYELVENREIIVEYQVPSLHSGNNQITLAHTPIDLTTKVESNGERCMDFVTQENVIDITPCNFSMNQTAIDLSYKYLDDRLMDTFAFSKAIPVDLDQVEWSVFVNEVETNDYTRDDKTITLNQGVLTGVVVKIEARY